MFSEAGSALFSSCSFTGCSSADTGGAVRVSLASVAAFSSCNVTGSQVGAGHILGGCLSFRV